MTLKKRKYTPDAKGPLAGLRVLDLSRLFAGNVLTQILGDFGAEIIKVEPPAGDTLQEKLVPGVAQAGGPGTAAPLRSLGKSFH